MTEKVFVVDCTIQLNPTGPLRVVHVDHLILYPYHQYRANWVTDEVAHQEEKVIDVDTDPIVSQQTTVGVSIACQTFDTDPIVALNDKAVPTIIFHRSLRRRRKPCHLVYYLQI